MYCKVYYEDYSRGLQTNREIIDRNHGPIMRGTDRQKCRSLNLGIINGSSIRDDQFPIIQADYEEIKNSSKLGTIWLSDHQNVEVVGVSRETQIYGVILIGILRSL